MLFCVIIAADIKENILDGKFWLVFLSIHMCGDKNNLVSKPA